METEPDPITVLCVDDEPDVVGLVATFLERQDDDFTVATATSASEGLDRVADGGVDCIVADYDMPGRDGIEFLEAVRETHGDLPFVLFTGKGSEEIASEAISVGATDYLRKGTGTERYELLANRVRNAVERYRADQRAAELDRIRTLASDVNQALVRADTRSEAETRVCEILSESDPYLFAWIGGVDPATDRIEPRASAGVGEGYLSDIVVTADESATGHGPGGTAFREGRVVVAQDIQEDPDFEPWREAADERGFRGVAAVPLEHEGDRYGVLAVYADRPGAFDTEERDLLAELGDNIGHTIHSVDVEERLREERDRRRVLFENAPGPVVAGEITGDGSQFRITDANDAFETVFGYDTSDAFETVFSYDADSVVGEGVADVVVPESGRERHETVKERTAVGKSTVAEVERLTATGPRKFLVQVIPYGTDGEQIDGFYRWYTDITERERRKRAVERLHETSRALTSAETREAAAEIVVDAARDVLDLPVNAVQLHDEDAGGLVPVAWTAEVEDVIGDPPTLPRGDSLAWKVFETGEPQTFGDVSTVEGRYNPETRIRSDLIMPLGDHGVLVVGSTEADAFDDTDVSLARTLAAHARAALDRIDRERKLTALHDVATDLEQGDSVEHICEQTVQASERILEFDLSIIDIENDGYLEKAAVSEDIPSEATTRMSVDRGVAGKTYRSGESILVEDLDECDAAEPQGPYRSAISVPVGDHGVFQAVGTEPGAFDETDLELTGLLVSHAENALDRLDHERELERQNERLQEFASIVSHDLRNPLNVAIGRLELVREECDHEQLDDVAQAHERMESLIDDLLALARTGGASTDPRDVALADAVRRCWDNVETGEATVVVETERTVRADPGQLRRLFENLFRNAVEHGSTGPDSQARQDSGGAGSSEPSVAGGPDEAVEHDSTFRRSSPTDEGPPEHRDSRVTITVGDTDDGFYVADDGQGIPPDERDRVFEPGYSTVDGGTGFGLKIVERTAAAHGWTVDVTESESGGARFEFVTDTSAVDAG
ncbi:MAG: GAF domain-containing protein [Haloarculaceae archaeon]